jgi:hypothetical protein
VGPQHRELRVQQGGELPLPWRVLVDGRIDLGGQPVGQRVQQLVFVLEMPVQRHRGHAELAGESADGHRLDAFGVGEDHGAVDDDRPTEQVPAASLPHRHACTAYRT